MCSDYDRAYRAFVGSVLISRNAGTFVLFHSGHIFDGDV